MFNLDDIPVSNADWIEGEAMADSPSAEDIRHEYEVQGPLLRNGLQISDNRHTGVQHMGPRFAFAHLPKHVQPIAQQFTMLGQYLVDHLKDGPELIEALRKLWEAKNCAVLDYIFQAGPVFPKEEVNPEPFLDKFPYGPK